MHKIYVPNTSNIWKYLNKYVELYHTSRKNNIGVIFWREHRSFKGVSVITYNITSPLNKTRDGEITARGVRCLSLCLVDGHDKAKREIAFVQIRRDIHLFDHIIGIHVILTT